MRLCASGVDLKLLQDEIEKAPLASVHIKRHYEQFPAYRPAAANPRLLCRSNKSWHRC
ncbi:Hypothetical protein P9211_17231 [Prochlorococcus marinus str. MIT 9211]|uniref:Uncharacterized protein n=1 Tax=Prochlorococcus marinus (strain MIT 9211) TaxID=93059 RepID=A9BCU2_PROM4|nr:Hypothetical protein P9211_17231 [Prochlorococcus marinus str. MIT 9211]